MLVCLFVFCLFVGMSFMCFCFVLFCLVVRGGVLFGFLIFGFCCAIRVCNRREGESLFTIPSPPPSPPQQQQQKINKIRCMYNYYSRNSRRGYRLSEGVKLVHLHRKVYALCAFGVNLELFKLPFDFFSNTFYFFVFYLLFFFF